MSSPSSPISSTCSPGFAGGDPERTVIWVRGDLDLATKVSLTAGITAAARRDDADVLVDLSGVTFMEASTVGVIVGIRERLRSVGRSLEVRAPSPLALRVLELCGLTHLVRREPARATGAAALASWVDVPTLAPSGEIGHEVARNAECPTAPQPDRALVAAVTRVEEAVVEVDRRGP